MENVYKKSRDLLQRSLKVIPLAAQTFSKSYQQFPRDTSPLFIERGEGSHVWDVDGNEYVDLISGLLPVILGYRDPEVDAAIQQQIQKGITFSLPTELQVQLAERLVDIIPCAEMVRFGKNGSDATTAAVRLARAFTKRDRVAVCGYHGWHDWYIGSTTRDYGVPKATSELTHTFQYNDTESLHRLFKKYPGEFSAVIMEPMNTVEPQNDFLAAVKALAHDNGALLIFDEVITGFRVALGGAQEYFSVTPDLAAFGKAMGNGMPISCVLGRADVMSLLNDVFVSGTFGGEALSMAAAMAVIDKMQHEPVVETIWKRGAALAKHVEGIIAEFDLNEVFSLSGMPPWKILSIKDYKGNSSVLIKTIFMREMLKQGILIQGSHNISYAHSDEDIVHVVDAYRTTLKLITRLINEGSLEASLEGPVLKPVFSVR